MKISAHKLGAPAAYKAAHAHGGSLKQPAIIIVHDTAGRLDAGSSVAWFQSDACNTSAHIVVERDGSVVQMVPFNVVAYHAGRSEWAGRSGCNSFAIGIEIVNPGKLDKDGRAWFHKKTEKGFPLADLKHVKTKEHGDGWWMPYTDAQVQAVTDICRALVAAYPSIEEVVTHWLVSPGRKIDTNPLFPLDQVRTAVFQAQDDVPVASMAPQVVKAESAVAVAYRSRSVWAQIMGVVSVVAGVVTDWARSALDWVLWAVGIVPKVADEVKETLTSGEELAKFLHLNWKAISWTVACVCVAVTIYLRIQDKQKETSQ